MSRKTKTGAKGGDTRARAAANGKKVGRPKSERPPEVKDSQFAARVLALVGGPKWRAMHDAVELYRNAPKPVEGKTYVPPPHPKTLVKNDEDLALYYTVCGDLGIESNNFRALTEKRDGKAMHTVNHLHDKPIEMNVTVSMAELIREVRQRKQDYERTRK